MANPNAAAFFNTCFLKYFSAGPPSHLKIESVDLRLAVSVEGSLKEDAAIREVWMESLKNDL